MSLSLANARFGLFVASALGLASCRNIQDKLKKSDSEERQAEAAAVTDESFVSSDQLSKGGNLRTLTASEVQNEINGTAGLYANKPKKPAKALDAASDKCFDDRLAAMKFHASGKKGYFASTFDFSDCLRQSFASPSSEQAIRIDALAFTLRFLIRLECTTDDLTAFDGKSLNEMKAAAGDPSGADRPPCKDYKSLFQSSMQVNFKLSSTAVGESNSIEQETTTISAQAQADGSLCHYKAEGNKVMLDGDCVEASRDTFQVDKVNGRSGGKEGKEEIKKIVLKAVVEGPAKPTYFETGSADMTLNDWTGSVTFAGGENAPTWSMKSGAKTAGSFLIPSYLPQKAITPLPRITDNTPIPKPTTSVALTEAGEQAENLLIEAQESLKDKLPSFGK